MSCLTDLMAHRSQQSEEKRWKYVINLCGKELPLVSTHTTVSYLSQLNGTSAIMASEVEKKDIESWRRLRKRAIPFNLKYYKCVVYMAISYKFAHYLLTNSTAIKVREFFKTCSNPEEHFYATLYMIPGVPGGFNPSIYTNKPLFPRCNVHLAHK